MAQCTAPLCSPGPDKTAAGPGPATHCASLSFAAARGGESGRVPNSTSNAVTLTRHVVASRRTKPCQKGCASIIATLLQEENREDVDSIDRGRGEADSS